MKQKKEGRGGKRPGAGRPAPAGTAIPTTMRLHPATLEAIATLAARWQTKSKTEAVERAIAEAVKKSENSL